MVREVRGFGCEVLAIFLVLSPLLELLSCASDVRGISCEVSAIFEVLSRAFEVLSIDREMRAIRHPSSKLSLFLKK
jgi:hypothetical protein